MNVERKRRKSSFFLFSHSFDFFLARSEWVKPAKVKEFVHLCKKPHHVHVDRDSPIWDRHILYAFVREVWRLWRCLMISCCPSKCWKLASLTTSFAVSLWIIAVLHHGDISPHMSSMALAGIDCTLAIICLNSPRINLSGFIKYLACNEGLSAHNTLRHHGLTAEVRWHQSGHHRRHNSAHDHKEGCVFMGAWASCIRAKRWQLAARQTSWWRSVVEY